MLFGCPIDISKRYDVEGYVGTLQTGDIGLVSDKLSAYTYVDDKEPGHGTPTDWAKLFKEDYGLNVHPIFIADKDDAS